MPELKYTESLQDNTSPEYKTLAENVTNEVRDADNYCCEHGENTYTETQKKRDICCSVLLHNLPPFGQFVCLTYLGAYSIVCVLH